MIGWVRKLYLRGSPHQLPFEAGLRAGLVAFGYRLVLIALSYVVALVLLASVAILLRLGGF